MSPWIRFLPFCISRYLFIIHLSMISRLVQLREEIKFVVQLRRSSTVGSMVFSEACRSKFCPRLNFDSFLFRLDNLLFLELQARVSSRSLSERVTSDELKCCKRLCFPRESKVYESGLCLISSTVRSWPSLFGFTGKSF